MINPFTSKYETETDELDVDTDNAASFISCSTFNKDQQTRTHLVSDLSSNTLLNYDNMNEKKNVDSMTSISSSSLTSSSSTNLDYMKMQITFHSLLLCLEWSTANNTANRDNNDDQVNLETEMKEDKQVNCHVDHQIEDNKTELFLAKINAHIANNILLNSIFVLHDLTV